MEEYANIIQAVEHDPLSQMIDLKIVEIKPGYARGEIEVQPKHLNPIASVHGGCLYTMADVVAGCAAESHGATTPTLDSSFHFLNAGLNVKKLIAEATELKKGKRILVYDIKITNQDDLLLATGIFTYMNIDKTS